jgi:hypothetical protein
MNLNDLRKEIFARRPEFGKVFATWGDKTLLHYYKQNFAPLTPSSHTVLSAIETEVSAVLGTTVGARARTAVAQSAWVNTADHHGLVHHPYFYTTALARSHGSVRKENQATVTLPFGGVSLSNDSFPRGFSFHDANTALCRVFFKSLQDRRLPVYALAPMSRTEFIHEQKRANSFTLAPQAKLRLMHFFEAVLADERVWSQTTFSRQLTALNAVLWQVLFADSRGDFVYLQIDDIANRLLLKKHLVTTTPIYELLFTPAWRQTYIELFTGISGAHTDTTGTHFFWYIDHNHHTRRSLFIRGDTLATAEGDIEIPLDPERIAAGLQSRELMPGTTLMLLLLHSVEGLACGGGPSQLEYLTQTMAAWTALRIRLGHLDPTVIPTTHIWCADNTLCAVTSKGTTDTKLATLFDILLYADDVTSFIDTALETTTLGATIDAMAPTLYTMYTRLPVNCPDTIRVPTIQL